MATLVPVAVNPTGPGFVQALASDTISIPGSFALPGLTQGSVLFAGASGVITQDNANFFWDDTNNRLGVGLAAPLATVHVVQPVLTSTPREALLVTGGAHTTLTLSTEAPDVNISITRTVQWATGALTTQRAVKIGQPTYAFVGASTLATAATVAIAGAPKSGANATLSAAHGILVEAGNVGGGVAVTAAYGLTVNAPAGATANYCAAFVGGNVGMGTTATAPGDILDVSGVRIPSMFVAQLEPTGFLVPGAATGYVEAPAVLTFDNTVPVPRTFTITGNHTVYVNGVRYAKTTASIQIANTTGLHWIYYDKTTLVLTETLGSPTTAFQQVLIATVYWQVSTSRGFLSDERHGLTMDSRTHEYLHDTIGTRYEPSGLSGTFQTGAPQLSITKGVIWDEDIEINIPTGAGPTTTCRSMYLDPVTAAGWFFDVADAAVPYRMSGNFMLYNNPAAGTPYALTASGANQYVVTWIYATPRVANGIMSIIGQAASASVATARTANTPEGLNLGTLPTAEMKLLYRVIWQNNGSATPAYVETLDYRNVTNLPGSTTAITAHGALSGLANDDHTQYLLLAGRGGQTITDYLTLTEPAAAAGSPVALTVTGGAHTTLAASTEATDVYVNLARTVQWATGSFALQRAVRVLAPTYAFVGASTVDNAIAVVINGAPAAGVNATLKGSTALWVRTAAVNGGGAVDASYGLIVQAMTGATANYAALFSGGTSGFGAVRTDAYLNVDAAVATTGSPAALRVMSAKPTTLTASVEASAVIFALGTECEWATGALATQRAVRVEQPNYKFVGASVVTTAATMAITGAPAAFTNATITSTHGLLIQAADVTNVGVGTATASYGLTVNAQTGGTSNFAARLVGASGAQAAVLLVEQVVVNGGAVAGVGYVGAANLNQTLSTEIKSFAIITTGREWATGALALQREVHVTQPTYAFIGASVITDAATFAISAPPKADANATITSAHGILVQTATVAGAGTVTAAYGLTVNAPTGATSNAAAQFVGAHGTQSVVVLIQETAESTGAVAALGVLGAAKTGQTAGTEIGFVTIQPASRQWATGAVGFQREIKISQPTYSFVGASVITDAATLYVAAAPKADANATITSAHGIYVNTASVVAAGAVTTSYGLTVNAMSGAGANYAAQFMGGNVGILTATPANASLVVYRDTAAYNDGTANHTTVQLQATDTNNDHSGIEFINVGATRSAFFGVVQVGATDVGVGHFIWQGYDGTAHKYQELMKLTDQGFVYMPLIEAGAGTYPVKWTAGTGELTNDTSDARQKFNVRPYAAGLDEVCRLEPKQYLYRGGAISGGELRFSDAGRERVGLIAQEVWEVLPEVVARPADDREGLWGVDYSYIVPALINAVKTLRDRVAELEGRPA